MDRAVRTKLTAEPETDCARDCTGFQVVAQKGGDTMCGSRWLGPEGKGQDGEKRGAVRLWVENCEVRTG